MYSKNLITIHNRRINYFRINNNVNGNPRYVIHYTEIDRNWETAITTAKQIGGTPYRAKWYGGGIVFTSYNLENDLKSIIMPATELTKTYQQGRLDLFGEIFEDLVKISCGQPEPVTADQILSCLIDKIKAEKIENDTANA